MKTFVDICSGFGSMTKAFERTGAYRCIGAVEINENMRQQYQICNGNRMPMENILSEKTVELLNRITYDILIGSTVKIEEDVFYAILKIIEKYTPKAFVIEMDTGTFSYGFVKTVNNFCKKNGYKFVGYNQGVDNITLNLENFGVPEFCERIWCIGIRYDALRFDDDLVLQLNQHHDFKCYEYVDYNPSEKIEQRRGIDWGFGDNFQWLIGTPTKEKEGIIDFTTPFPMATSVALDLMSWFD